MTIAGASLGETGRSGASRVGRTSEAASLWIGTTSVRGKPAAGAERGASVRVSVEAQRGAGGSVEQQQTMTQAVSYDASGASSVVSSNAASTGGRVVTVVAAGLTGASGRARYAESGAARSVWTSTSSVATVKAAMQQTWGGGAGAMSLTATKEQTTSMSRAVSYGTVAVSSVVRTNSALSGARGGKSGMLGSVGTEWSAVV